MSPLQLSIRAIREAIDPPQMLLIEDAFKPGTLLRVEYKDGHPVIWTRRDPTGAAPFAWRNLLGSDVPNWKWGQILRRVREDQDKITAIKVIYPDWNGIDTLWSYTLVKDQIVDRDRGALFPPFHQPEVHQPENAAIYVLMNTRNGNTAGWFHSLRGAQDAGFDLFHIPKREWEKDEDEEFWVGYGDVQDQIDYDNETDEYGIYAVRKGKTP